MNKLICLVVMFAFALTGCKKEDSSGANPSASGKTLKICFLPKQLQNPYFQSCEKGAREAAKELGNVEVIYDGPQDGAADKAASMIEKWTLQGVDAIAVAPSDPNVLAAAMKAAREKGVKVITFDADGLPETRAFFVNQATPQQIGYALVDTMAKDIGGTDPQGEVAIITGFLTADNQNQWIKFIKERLAKYPGFKLVDVVPSDDKPDIGFQRMQDLMKAHPNLKAVFAITSVAFPAAADAIQQAGKSGKVLITGLAQPNNMKSHVKDGTVKSVILWNTSDLGYLTIQVANALAKGTLKPGDTSIKTQRLGESKIVGDNVLLGDILVFTKDNIDQYDF